MGNSVTCDFCQKDLSKTGQMSAYRLRLRAEKIPQPGGTYFVVVSPPVEGELAFCSVEHLQNWLRRAADTETVSR